MGAKIYILTLYAVPTRMTHIGPELVFQQYNDLKHLARTAKFLKYEASSIG